MQDQGKFDPWHLWKIKRIHTCPHILELLDCNWSWLWSRDMWFWIEKPKYAGVLPRESKNSITFGLVAKNANQCEPSSLRGSEFAIKQQGVCGEIS